MELLKRKIDTVLKKWKATEGTQHNPKPWWIIN